MQAIHLRDFGDDARTLRRGRAIFVGNAAGGAGLDDLGLDDLGLSDLGLSVEPYAEVFTAFSDMVDDPSGLALFVLDCDMYGGHDVAERLIMRLRAMLPRLPVVLLATDSTTILHDHDARPVVVDPARGRIAVHKAVRHVLRTQLRWQDL